MSMSKTPARQNVPPGEIGACGSWRGGRYTAYTLWKRADLQQRNQTLKRSQHIVILGGGFAGTNVADQLAALLPNPEDATITLVDQSNYSLFTPMLTEVAGGQVDTHHIVRPLRNMSPRIEFIQGRIEAIDTARKCVRLSVGDTQSNLPQTARFCLTIIWLSPSAPFRIITTFPASKNTA